MQFEREAPVLQFLETTWPTLLMGIGIPLVIHLVRTRVPRGERIFRAFVLVFPIVVAIVVLVVGPPVSRWIVAGTGAVVALIWVVHRWSRRGAVPSQTQTG